MNFALLDIDEDVIALARQIAESAEHSISSYCHAGEFTAVVQRIAPYATALPEWEALLVESDNDCVIVGRADHVEARADKIKKLVQEKVPLIVVHPACEAIVGYEIEMIRRDVGSPIVPYYPGIGSQTTQSLAAAISAERLGVVEQVTIERRMPERLKAQVLAQLARDVAIVREIVGPIKSVGAMGSLDDRAGAISLAVQLTSESGCLVRWSLEPAAGELAARITLLGRAGKAICNMPAIGDWQTRFHDDAAPDIVDNRSHEATQLFAALTADADATLSPLPAWVDACRAQEVVDTIPRCLARNKTVELYNEEHTEESAFKGVMAVGGCLILMLGLLLLFVVAVIESLQLPLYRFSVWNNWPLYICAGFSFFLLLQLLRFVARGKE